ncbi:hypothetical protein [Pygmaiobacter massiliensis]|nr:hypothetical protein [Pygmaiobacter massiliensis]
MKNKRIFATMLLIGFVILLGTLEAGKPRGTKPHGFYAEPLKSQ